VRLKALVWIVRPGPSGPQVLLLERPERRAGGEHPVTGKADPGESAAQCAEREAFEETGLRGELVDLQYAHRFRGRRGEFEERAFMLRVRPDATPTISDEHIGYRWISAAEARSVIRWGTHARALDLALEKGS
jgi:8-oxo-dGTP pyrophosphatase MutT (NUDIX family)